MRTSYSEVGINLLDESLLIVYDACYYILLSYIYIISCMAYCSHAYVGVFMLTLSSSTRLTLDTSSSGLDPNTSPWAAEWPGRPEPSMGGRVRDGDGWCSVGLNSRDCWVQRASKNVVRTSYKEPDWFMLEGWLFERVERQQGMRRSD